MLLSLPPLFARGQSPSPSVHDLWLRRTISGLGDAGDAGDAAGGTSSYFESAATGEQRWDEPEGWREEEEGVGEEEGVDYEGAAAASLEPADVLEALELVPAAGDVLAAIAALEDALGAGGLPGPAAATTPLSPPPPLLLLLPLHRALLHLAGTATPSAPAPVAFPWGRHAAGRLSPRTPRRLGWRRRPEPGLPAWADAAAAHGRALPRLLAGLLRAPAAPPATAMLAAHLLACAAHEDGEVALRLADGRLLSGREFADACVRGAGRAVHGRGERAREWARDGAWPGDSPLLHAACAAADADMLAAWLRLVAVVCAGALREGERRRRRGRGKGAGGQHEGASPLGGEEESGPGAEGNAPESVAAALVPALLDVIASPHVLPCLAIAAVQILGLLHGWAGEGEGASESSVTAAVSAALDAPSSAGASSSNLRSVLGARIVAALNELSGTKMGAGVGGGGRFGVHAPGFAGADAGNDNVDNDDGDDDGAGTVSSAFETGDDDDDEGGDGGLGGEDGDGEGEEGGDTAALSLSLPVSPGRRLRHLVALLVDLLSHKGVARGAGLAPSPSTASSSSSFSLYTSDAAVLGGVSLRQVRDLPTEDDARGVWACVLEALVTRTPWLEAGLHRQLGAQVEATVLELVGGEGEEGDLAPSSTSLLPAHVRAHLLRLRAALADIAVALSGI
jgi:hypothetical protein